MSRGSRRRDTRPEERRDRRRTAATPAEGVVQPKRSRAGILASLCAFHRLSFQLFQVLHEFVDFKIVKLKLRHDRVKSLYRRWMKNHAPHEIGIDDAGRAVSQRHRGTPQALERGTHTRCAVHAVTREAPTFVRDGAAAALIREAFGRDVFCRIAYLDDGVHVLVGGPTELMTDDREDSGL